MTIFDVEIGAPGGGPARLDRYRGHPALMVNVASRCGHTPRYAGPQARYERCTDRRPVITEVPSKQFPGQRPGTAGDIVQFHQVGCGGSFPLRWKIDVNGDARHPLYKELVASPDEEGYSGDISWNFEKFFVAPDGTVATRFAPKTDPQDDGITAAVEKLPPR
jgi:glutathione peroxidase